MSTHDESNDMSRRGLRRREALAAAGTLGLGGLLGATRLGGGTAEAGTEAAACILTPEVTEGPYWIENDLTRRDIRTGKDGLPLEIVFTVQHAKTCDVLANADVEIWHCDAKGVYSGYESLSRGPGATPGEPPTGGPPPGRPPTGQPPAGGGGGHQEPTDGKRYLRGHQKTDAEGRARFLTVFPGWYAGRTPHIHLKVHVGGDVVHTGQVFFNERITAAVYKRAPYKSHGQPDTRHAADSIFAQAGRSRAVLRLAERRKGRRGYRGTITLGIATS
jgi:protocatechuate 3,4-dioxygenase beta subunit